MSSDNNERKFFETPDDVQAYLKWCEEQAFIMATFHMVWRVLDSLRNGDKE